MLEIDGVPGALPEQTTPSQSEPAAVPPGAGPLPGTFVVMTQNAGNGMAQPARLVEVLRECGADLIGLEELTVPQATAIDENLADLYPYRALYGDGIPGKGVISRFPILGARQLELYSKRPDLWTLVDLDGTPVDFIVGHPRPPRVHRNGIYADQPTRQQIQALTDLATRGDPALLVGDFNLTEGSQVYTDIQEAGLTDAFRASGAAGGNTLPVRYRGIRMRAVLRVDYIWYTPHFATEAAWVGPDSGSDHLPVLARLRWAAAASAEAAGTGDQ